MCEAKCKNKCSGCGLCDSTETVVKCDEASHERYKWDPVAWLSLPLCGKTGRQDGPNYMRLELRNCVHCGTTLAVHYWAKEICREYLATTGKILDKISALTTMRLIIRPWLDDTENDKIVRRYCDNIAKGLFPSPPLGDDRRPMSCE